MVTTLDAELELLGATARRHLADLSPRTSVHVSAAVNALTDPLVPPRLSGVDVADTADLAGVLRAVRGRLLHAAQHAEDVQQTLAIGFAARELTHALATLTPDTNRSTERGNPAATGNIDAPHAPTAATGHDGGPAQPGRPAR